MTNKPESGMQVAPHIFREYDIRGLVDRELTAEVVEAIARAYAGKVLESTGVPNPRVAVGHDNRLSSPALAEACIRGLLDCGCHVVDVGTVPTPALYFASHALRTEGAVQITASHNPAEFNGLKLLLGPSALYGPAIRDVRRRVQEGAFPAAAKRGGLSREPILERYVEDVTSRFRLARPLKAAVDCGNGTASLAAVDLLTRIGAHVQPLYCESDGTFPNHHPDPTVDENLRDLIEHVRRTGADIGIAFDGDGDRLGVVDERGTIIRGDELLLIFAVDALKRGTTRAVIFDVKCSQALPDVIRAHGGEPVMWKTGHSLIKEKMREMAARGARLAGEMSGHFFFADDHYGYDDALYAACRLLDLLARSGGRASDLTARFPRYVSTPELRVACPEERKWDVVRAAVDHFRARYPVVDLDGARVRFDGGWALIRASNTQPALVLRYEARDAAALERIRGEVEAWLRAAGVGVEV